MEKIWRNFQRPEAEFQTMFRTAVRKAAVVVLGRVGSSPDAF